MFFTASPQALRRNVYTPAGLAFERFLNDACLTGRSTLANPLSRTATQYAQDETSYTLTLDMPGIAKDQLGISIEGAVVRLQSKEGASRQYRAAYELPQDIDATLSEAKLEHGVLTLKLAKKVPVNNATELAIL